MLKGIPKYISPDLLKALAELGHGDELVIADGNFPAERLGKKCIRADGHGVPEILDAVLQLIPLDTYVDAPIGLMEVCEGDTCGTPTIWDEYNKILCKHEPDNHEIEFIERFAFYDRAAKAELVIATGEEAIYANVILKKGVVK